MYESYFQLTERPFAAIPHVKHFYPARAIEAARRTLVRCIERAEGAGVLIGPSGTGKSMLCQLLRHQFRDTFAVALLGRTRIDTPRALLQGILYELGLPCRGMDDGELRLALIDQLTQGAQDCGGLLLIADEAHTLPARVLEEIRLITNVTVAGQASVRFVMAGSPLLEEHLASPKLESFSQRTAARCYLEHLDRGETCAYIRAQLATAGMDMRQVFTDAALESVYRASDGVPRLINQVCDHALVLAYANGVKRLAEREIEEAWADLQQLPTPWNAAQNPAQADSVVEFGQLDDEEETPPTAHVGLRLATGLDDVEAEAEAEEDAGGYLADGDELETSPARDFTAQITTAEQQLDRIEAQLSSIEMGLAPRTCAASEMAHTGMAYPFQEAFAEEEVVVDRFSSAHSAVWDNMPHVYSAEGRVLAELLEPFVQTAKPAVAAAACEWPTADQSDLIVVEDDPLVMQTARALGESAFRQEYSQLFAKLRRG